MVFFTVWIIWENSFLLIYLRLMVTGRLSIIPIHASNKVIRAVAEFFLRTFLLFYSVTILFGTRTTTMRARERNGIFNDGPLPAKWTFDRLK